MDASQLRSKADSVKGKNAEQFAAKFHNAGLETNAVLLTFWPLSSVARPSRYRAPTSEDHADVAEK